MGIIDRFKRAFSSSPAEDSTVAPPTSAPEPRSAPDGSVPVPSWMYRGPEHLRYKSVARALSVHFHGENVPPDVLMKTAAVEGVDPEAVRRQIELDRTPGERLVVRPRSVNPDELRVVDLSALESARMRIKGSAYTVNDAERRRQSGPSYLLIREPDNEADAFAVAVYGMRGRRVGYLSASRAATVSPLLAQLDGDAFKVSGAGTTKTSIVISVDVPKADALRRFVRDATG